jgi:ferrous-iron efflux pump FieF
MDQHAAVPLSASPPKPSTEERGAALNRSAAYASIAVASLLAVMKMWAAWRTGSTAMLGSLADTALDLIASIATLIGVWIAAQPADAKHRFGHGKAEALAAMFQVVLISISAIGLALRAIAQFLEGGRTAQAEGGILVSIVAILATLALLGWQRHVIRRTASVAINTDHLHYQSDLALNLAVIAALALEQYAGIPRADAVFGLVIACWLGWSAWRASHQAIEQLMDHEWPVEKKQRFIELLARNPDLRGVHDLRTRTAGNRDFVQFHVWVDPKMTIREAHKVMDAIEARLLAEFPGTEILIHPDPDGLVNEQGQAAEDVLAQAEETPQGAAA